MDTIDILKKEIQNLKKHIVHIETKYQSILQNTYAIQYRFNIVDNTFDYISPRVAEIFNISLEELKQTGPKEIIDARTHPDDVKMTSDYWRRFPFKKDSDKKHHTIEYRWQTDSGEYIWLSDYHILVRDEQKNPQFIVGSVSDITEEKKYKNALEVSEERYRSLIEGLNHVIVSFNPEGKIIYCSSNIKRFGGYYSDKEIGQHYSKYIKDPEKLSELNMIFRDLLEKPQSTNFEFLYNAKDKKPFHVEANARSIIDPKTKNIIGVQCIVRDISERKLNEIALIENEKKYRTLFENMTQGVFYQQADGKLIDCNPALLKIFGLTRKQFLGRNSMDPQWKVIHEDGSDIPGDQHPSMIALKTGKPVKDFVAGIYNLQKKKYIWILINAIPQFYKRAKEPYQVFVTVHDITAKKQSVELEKENERQIRILTENLPGGVFAHDMEGKILFVNKAACELTGYSQDELLTKYVSDIDPESITRKDREKLWQVLNKGEAKTITGTHVRKNGTKYKAEIHLNSIFFENKPIILPIVLDITKRKKLEKEKNKLIQDLEVKNSEMERFIYTVSHDLRSPMITIEGFIGLLKKEIENDNKNQILEYVKYISNATQQMGNLLNDLLELSRIGRVVNVSTTITMNIIVKEALLLLEGSINQNNVTIKVQPNMPEVIVDRVRIKEVFVNLIENAIKYRKDEKSPEITIGCDMNREEASFFVQDNGIGIDSKYHQKIFGLFDQLNPKADGTGVGLALVRRIIEFHGGKIWIESEGVNKGATFYFTLPNNIDSEKMQQHF